MLLKVYLKIRFHVFASFGQHLKVLFVCHLSVTKIVYFSDVGPKLVEFYHHFTSNHGNVKTKFDLDSEHGVVSY